MATVTLFAAVAGIVIAREFGRTDETDGLFAAYGVFIVVVLAAQAIRIAVIPALTLARVEQRLAGETAAIAVAIAVFALPLVLFGVLAAETLAAMLTGDGSRVARDTAAEALRWMLPAAGLHLFAGLAASGLAALDDYATAALGYATGSAAGLALILTEVESQGVVVIAWAMTLNAAVVLLVLLARVVWLALATRMPIAAIKPGGVRLRDRLRIFAAATALPLALQLFYVVCLPFAGRLGEGAVTSFGYAYLGAASFVTMTAFSLGLVTSAPLARGGLDAARAARHVVASSWLALAFIGGATGLFALAGADIVELLLGGAYGDEVGSEIATLVVLLAPWTIASVGVNIAFPLTFVADVSRLLPGIAAVLLSTHVGLAWFGSELLGLAGLAAALAVSTGLVLCSLLHVLGALSEAAIGIARAAVAVTLLAAAAFVPVGLALSSVSAALVGIAVYALLLGLVRPRSLRASWDYLRALA
jgi:hypothetical protein